MDEMESKPNAALCICGGKAHLGYIGAAFIFIGCPECGRQTDPVTVVYQSDEAAWRKAVELWAGEVKPNGLDSVTDGPARPETKAR